MQNKTRATAFCPREAETDLQAARPRYGPLADGARDTAAML